MHSIVGSKSSFAEQQNDVVLQGYHKKLKTMKKKYFVLCGETASRAARLEYYDTEKKFKSRSNPKKTIILKNCFNINRRLDTKYKYVIALSVRDEGFCIVLDNEEELNKWLKALLTLQRGEDTESEMPKPNFEHVWQVQVQRKGLAEEKGLLGSYHVCLTLKSLTLYRIGSPRTNQNESRLYSVEFELTTIRRCGDSQCYFYMEVGRHSAIGAGELWMETEDTLIAQNMHTMIINAMSCMRGREDLLGPMRKRSSSETSKPTSGIQRRQTTSGMKPINSSPQTNSTLGRDRCDSLPSRNRTISECSNQSITNPSMPPPKTIPINRPHSMYTNRHSHSPPANAISPSTGCSESEGSSQSIDEPDSLDHSSTPDESGNFVTHYFNPLSSQVTIPEEKDEIWYSDNKTTSSDTEIPFIDKLNNHGGLSLPLSTHRRESPAMNSHTGSIDMQSQYMDMCSPYSPCGSSPCDPVGSGYIPISPSVECNRGLYTGSSGGHSRASSLAEETVDGYVPMCPPNQPPTEEYVDMEQSGKQNLNNPSGFSSAASSSSITSGTPSTDLKFAEYPLEKVTSRFTPDDEDMQSISDRPTRAYSVGSRVEHNKRKLRMDFGNDFQNNSRVRAFSVGSRAKVPRCDLSRGVLQYNLFTNHINATNCNPNNNIELTFNAKQRNNKSSSAPLLIHKNHSSVERMSDLMEIDFSKNSADSSSSSGSRRNLDMSSSFLTQSTQSAKSSRISSIPVTVPFSSTTKSNTYNKATPPGYLEMRPGSFPDNNCFSSSPLSLSKFQTSGEGSNNSINHSNINCGYLEMKPVYVSKSPSLSSSPSKSMLSPKFSAKPHQHTQSYPISAKEYNSMNINNCNNNRTINLQSEYINISPSEFTSNITTIKENEKSVDPEQYSSTSDGYVPMNRNKHNTDTKSDKDHNQFWINRSTSMPIDIKNSNQPKHKYSIDLDTSAIITNQNDIHSQDLQHQQDTGLSDHSMCNQNTMFSLSPCSPQKTFDANQINNSNTITNNVIERKCMVDASNGTVTLLDNRKEKPKLNENSKNSISTLSSLQKLHISNINSNKSPFFKRDDNAIKNVESFLCNYTDMTLNICEKQKVTSNDLKKDKSVIATSEKISEQHDYVNFLPNNTLKIQEQNTTTDNSNNSSSNIGSDNNVILSDNSILKADKSIVGCHGGSKTFPIRDTLSIGVFEGFKPINDEMNNNNNNNICINNNIMNNSKNNTNNINNNKNNNNIDNNNLNNVNTNNNNVLKKSPRTTTIASKNNQHSYCPTYELLRCDSSMQQNKFSLSRPSSVNSDKISPLKNTTISGQIRPNSANSECIPSAISNSSSTSTLCGGSSSTSSSSTLCGSKSQSPLASSRPQSFTDCTTFDIMRADSNSSADTLSSATTTIASGSINSNNLITSRPPSVVSEKELHYASLDLPQSTTPNPTTTSASSSSINDTKVNSSTSGDSSTSPSPNASCCQQQPAFAYAQIDFKKSSSGGSTDSGNISNIGIKIDQNSNNN